MKTTQIDKARFQNSTVGLGFRVDGLELESAIRNQNKHMLSLSTYFMTALIPTGQ